MPADEQAAAVAAAAAAENSLIGAQGGERGLRRESAIWSGLPVVAELIIANFKAQHMIT
jgi:hypothetical protein